MALPNEDKLKWEAYRERELREFSPILAKLGFMLDEDQPHVGGERYLMSGEKLVLLGRRASDEKRVVIKVSSQPEGMREIEREQACRAILKRVDFAYRTFLLPGELLFVRSGNCAISITAYIEERLAFLNHSLEEQFFLALRAFETQEGVHATAYAHAKIIKKTFGIVGAREYLGSFGVFRKNALAADPGNAELAFALKRAWELLAAHEATIERYSGFLTHADFTPHNFRVVDRDIYLLDHTSLRFGNKYESWARFLNYMIIYNRPLRSALADYVRKNREEEEYLNLRLMCAYKIGFLLQFYAGALVRTGGDLNTLSRERVLFWARVLGSILDDVPVSEEMVREYEHSRDSLRSAEEKYRQKELGQLS